jgi:NAD(P)-dependent dehydrogenase (short-subunit alcohol dehydrogenase family)
MQEKICMITGANRGIGKETAIGLAKMGAKVVMVCRDQERGEIAQEDVRRESGNPAVDLMLADLSSQKAIRQLAETFYATYPELNVLVNNAGIYRTRRTLSIDGVEIHFAVNFLAPFLLTNLLVGALKTGAPSRVVNLVGIYHRKARINFGDLMGEENYSAAAANGQAKLALVLYTYELARRLKGNGVTVNCVHPGAVATDPLQSDPDSSAVNGFLYTLIKPFFASPEKGAEPSIYLASSPELEGVTGKFFNRKEEADSSPESHDRSIASQLWEVSEELTSKKSY